MHLHFACHKIFTGIAKKQFSFPEASLHESQSHTNVLFQCIQELFTSNTRVFYKQNIPPVWTNYKFWRLIKCPYTVTLQNTMRITGLSRAMEAKNETYGLFVMTWPNVSHSPDKLTPFISFGVLLDPSGYISSCMWTIWISIVKESRATLACLYRTSSRFNFRFAAMDLKCHSKYLLIITFETTHYSIHHQNKFPEILT